MDFQLIIRASEEIYLVFLLTGIFYNIVLFPYFLEENPQILSQFKNILVSAICIATMYKLTFHIIKVKRENDDIPINEVEENIQFMNHVARVFGHF